MEQEEVNEIVGGIIQSLEGFKDPDRVEFAKRSYPTKARVIGVVVPNEKLILKELRAETKACSGREKLDLAKAMMRTDIFECQHMAFEYVGKDKKALSALTAMDLADFNRNLDNWVSVDCFSAYLVGYAWREHKISTEEVMSYFDSDDFWRRRIPIVATVSLNQKARGGRGDAARTLAVCTRAMDDHADMINKALSWALRELAKIDRAPVEDFIAKHEKRLHPRVLREVRNKLEKGTKH